MPNLDAANRERIVEIVQKVVKQSDELIGGVLLLHEFIPVLAVTTVEAYLRDVLVYAASIDQTLMARSELASSYPEIWKAASLETLLDELRERAAKSNLRRLRRNQLRLRETNDGSPPPTPPGCAAALPLGAEGASAE